MYSTKRYTPVPYPAVHFAGRICFFLDEVAIEQAVISLNAPVGRSSRILSVRLAADTDDRIKSFGLFCERMDLQMKRTELHQHISCDGVEGAMVVFRTERA